MVYYAMAQNKKNKIGLNIIVLCRAVGYLVKSPVVISWILAVAGLVTLTAMSVPKLRAIQISAADLTVTFNNPPVWLDDSLLLELQNVARVHLANTTVSREGLIQTADALENTGWFSKVSQVQWVNDNEALIEATFLIPYAKVTDHKGDVYIDVQGRRLPTRTGAIVSPTYHFISLTNPVDDRPQRPGLQWRGGDVLSGLRLLQLIYDKPWATQVTNINLSRWSTNGSLVLETSTPCVLIWGAAPSEEQGLEALASHKIDRLHHLFTKYGRIDQGISTTFDLTHTASIIRN